MGCVKHAATVETMYFMSRSTLNSYLTKIMETFSSQLGRISIIIRLFTRRILHRDMNLGHLEVLCTVNTLCQPTNFSAIITIMLKRTLLFLRTMITRTMDLTIVYISMPSYLRMVIRVQSTIIANLVLLHQPIWTQAFEQTIKSAMTNTWAEISQQRITAWGPLTSTDMMRCKFYSYNICIMI